jgi:single-strand DNA-binding protein
MSDTIAITGIVATEPRHLVTDSQLPITSFRLASTQRRYSRAEQKWVDGDTNWYTVTVFRQLAINVAGSLRKGERVIVNGRLRIRDWEAGEKNGTTVDVEAESIGHDLLWGTTTFTRTVATHLSAEKPTEEEPLSAQDEVPDDAAPTLDERPKESIPF